MTKDIALMQMSDILLDMRTTIGDCSLIIGGLASADTDEVLTSTMYVIHLLEEETRKLAHCRKQFIDSLEE